MRTMTTKRELLLSPTSKIRMYTSWPYFAYKIFTCSIYSLSLLFPGKLYEKAGCSLV